MGQFKGRRAENKLERQQQALIRKHKRDKLSTIDQLAVLDKRFGVDQGASKERARLIEEATEKDGD